MKNKKGFTLSELAVVMAVLAIVVAMLVSFTTLMSGRVKRTNERNNVINNLSRVETAIKSWITHFDNIDYRITAKSGKLYAYDTKGTPGEDDDTEAGSISISDDGKKLICAGTTEWEISGIYALDFKVGGGESQIVYADMTYYDPSSENKRKTTRLLYTIRSGSTLEK